ncbi:MAG: TraB/GumN family protein [Sphingomonadaceae bacterium]
MRAIAFAFMLLLAACGTPQPSGPAKPALWKLSDADTTIYLFGTIHLLPKDYDWKSPKITAAIAQSQSLILEAVIDEETPDAGRVIADLGTDPSIPPLDARVPPAERAALVAAVDKAGLPRAQLDRMESWAVALILASAQLRTLPAAPEHGVEALLRREFRAEGKPVEGFETLAEQLGYFDGLSPESQARFLKSVVEDTADPRAQFDAMISAWRAGDVAKIALTFDDEAQLSPELRDALLDQRNARWAGAIVRRLETPGTVFIAVGAGHLAGAGSVQALLAAKGLKVERLQ